MQSDDVFGMPAVCCWVSGPRSPRRHHAYVQEPVQNSAVFVQKMEEKDFASHTLPAVSPCLKHTVPADERAASFSVRRAPGAPVPARAWPPALPLRPLLMCRGERGAAEPSVRNYL
ncbi:uncharacterized protein VSU04_013762 [Chlamydotis macqueenii]